MGWHDLVPCKFCPVQLIYFCPAHQFEHLLSQQCMQQCCAGHYISGPRITSRASQGSPQVAWQQGHRAPCRCSPSRLQKHQVLPHPFRSSSPGAVIYPAASTIISLAIMLRPCVESDADVTLCFNLNDMICLAQQLCGDVPPVRLQLFCCSGAWHVLTPRCKGMRT